MGLDLFIVTISTVCICIYAFRFKKQLSHVYIQTRNGDVYDLNIAQFTMYKVITIHLGRFHFRVLFYHSAIFSSAQK